MDQNTTIVVALSLLGILGSLITIGLGINAYFLRGIFMDLNDVKIHIATIFAQGEAKDVRLTKVEKDVGHCFKILRENKLKEKE